jgi:thiol-disulfide isomerase/thioredoxin
VDTGEDFSDEELEMLRAFVLKVEDHLTDSTFEHLRHIFPKSNIGSFKSTKSRVEFLASFKPVPYDCCINSCCCFVGPHEKAETCPYCKEARFKDGRARKRFTYIPIIPRFVAFFKNSDMVEAMNYRGTYESDPAVMKDVFDSENYEKLKKKYATIGGKQFSHKFFSDLRDIALGLSTDGFAPFKKRKQTCWPLLLFNYNLPPDIRFHLHNLLCIGVIPGPNKPKDFDSFLWPLVEELLKLTIGVPAFDVTKSEAFALRAYLILNFGDMPAMAMVMRMKGHNALFPCRMCYIKGIRVPGAAGPTLYVPLDRYRHPSCQAPNDLKKYDPANLPLRTHDEFIEQAQEVQFAPNAAVSERCAKACGIKGIPLLSHLSSLFFPTSFPLDFMHLIFENLIKNLVLLWTCKFKDVDAGSGSYELSPEVWEAIGEATAASGATIPSAYGARPQNVAQDKSACTADSWSFWALYLGPVLLRNRFRRDKYYDHFIELIKLINLCLQFEISHEDIETIRAGFITWVEGYEKYVYYYFTASTKLKEEIDFIINILLFGSPPAQLPFILFFILQMGSKHVGQFGHIGPFRWSVFVVSFYPASRAVDFRMPTLTLMLWRQRKSPKSKTAMD